MMSSSRPSLIRTCEAQFPESDIILKRLEVCDGREFCGNRPKTLQTLTFSPRAGIKPTTLEKQKKSGRDACRLEGEGEGKSGGDKTKGRLNPGSRLAREGDAELSRRSGPGKGVWSVRSLVKTRFVSARRCSGGAPGRETEPERHSARHESSGHHGGPHVWVCVLI
ncbi:hypothetical protein MHYP_G00141950 [Metynnis hypsauchen]